MSGCILNNVQNYKISPNPLRVRMDFCNFAPRIKEHPYLPT